MLHALFLVFSFSLLSFSSLLNLSSTLLYMWQEAMVAKPHFLSILASCSVNRSFEENGSFNPGKEIKAETQTYYQALIDNRDSPFIVSNTALTHLVIFC